MQITTASQRVRHLLSHAQRAQEARDPEASDRRQSSLSGHCAGPGQDPLDPPGGLPGDHRRGCVRGKQ